MKKILKRISLVLLIIILAIVVFFVVYMIKAKSQIKVMTPVESKELIKDIFSIQDSFSNLYLLKDSTGYIAIDAGNEIETVSSELEKLGIDPENVTTVLLTHTDGDHVAAIKLFKNAKVYLSKEEEYLITGDVKRFLYFSNKIDAKEYTLINDQETITIRGFTIKGILTPGHTPGSMCYLINGKYLFTGDALSLKDGKIEKFNELFNMDTEMAIKSIANITNLPGVEYIFTAHYGYCDGYKNAVKDWASSEQ